MFHALLPLDLHQQHPRALDRERYLAADHHSWVRGETTPDDVLFRRQPRLLLRPLREHGNGLKRPELVSRHEGDT